MGLVARHAVNVATEGAEWMTVDPFNDPDGRGKHPGNPDPIEHMVAGFEATIESRGAEIARLREALVDVYQAIFMSPALNGGEHWYRIPASTVDRVRAAVNGPALCLPDSEQ